MSKLVEERKRPHTDKAFADTSLYGMHREHTYAGALSFLRRHYTKDLTGVDIAVVGIPYDLATTNRPGTRFGPACGSSTRQMRRSALKPAATNCCPSGEKTALQMGPSRSTRRRTRPEVRSRNSPNVRKSVKRSSRLLGESAMPRATPNSRLAPLVRS